VRLYEHLEAVHFLPHAVHDGVWHCRYHYFSSAGSVGARGRGLDPQAELVLEGVIVVVFAGMMDGQQQRCCFEMPIMRARDYRW
jgi:hypothetical protein